MVDKNKTTDIKFECIRLAQRTASDSRLGRSSATIGNADKTIKSILVDAKEIYKWVNEE